MIEKIKIWYLATRAKTLLLSVCPVAIGAFLANREVKLNFSILFLTLLYALFSHIGTNLSNDYFDYLKGADTKERPTTLSTIQTKLTSLKQVKIAFITSFILAFLIGISFIFRGGPLVAFLFALPIICGFFYTGGLHPLGYLGFGEILVFVFLGPFAVLGTYFLQTLNLSYLPIVAGFGPGFLATGILVINNLRDLQVDKPANKKTLAVRFGKKFARIEYQLCILFALFIPLIFSIIAKKPLILSSMVFVFFIPVKLVNNFKNPFLLNTVIGKTVLLTIVYTIFFCIGLIY